MCAACVSESLSLCSVLSYCTPSRAQFVRVPEWLSSLCSVVKIRALSRVQCLRRARMSESLSSASTYALYRAQCVQGRPSLHVVFYLRIVFRAECVLLACAGGSSVLSPK